VNSCAQCPEEARARLHDAKRSELELILILVLFKGFLVERVVRLSEFATDGEFCCRWRPWIEMEPCRASMVRAASLDHAEPPRFMGTRQGPCRASVVPAVCARTMRLLHSPYTRG